MRLDAVLKKLREAAERLLVTMPVFVPASVVFVYVCSGGFPTTLGGRESQPP